MGPEKKELGSMEPKTTEPEKMPREITSGTTDMEPIVFVRPPEKTIKFQNQWKLA